jgi:hypothetical protein
LDWVALEYDANGNLLWSRVIVGSTTLPDYCWGMTVDASDAVILTGTLASAPGGYAAAKVSDNGSLVWTQLLGASGGAPYCEVRSDSVGNLYFASSSSLVSTDAAGSPRWQQVVTGQTRALELSASGNVLVTSAVNVPGLANQFVLTAFSAAGLQLGTLIHGGAGPFHDEFAPRGLVVAPGGAIYAVGSSHNSHDNDGYIVRYSLVP